MEDLAAHETPQEIGRLQLYGLIHLATIAVSSSLDVNHEAARIGSLRACSAEPNLRVATWHLVFHSPMGKNVKMPNCSTSVLRDGAAVQQELFNYRGYVDCGNGPQQIQSQKPLLHLSFNKHLFSK